MIDYKISNNKRCRYFFIISDKLSKYTWVLPPGNKIKKTTTDDFSNILTIPKRSPLKVESDRGAEFYDFIFQFFLKLKNIQHFSRSTDKGRSIVERLIRSVRNS